MYRVAQQLVKLAPLLIGVILAVGMLVFFNLDSPITHNELASLRLLPEPESLTELYFNANEQLPKSITQNHLISFTFTIHNLERTDFRYTYDVIVKTAAQTQVVDTGDILLRNDQYYSKTEKFHLQDTSKDQMVVVELPHKGQSIDFRIGQ